MYLRVAYLIFYLTSLTTFSPSKAVEILEAYEGTLEDDYPPESERCEHGEMLLYKVCSLMHYLLLVFFVNNVIIDLSVL